MVGAGPVPVLRPVNGLANPSRSPGGRPRQVREDVKDIFLSIHLKVRPFILCPQKIGRGNRNELSVSGISMVVLQQKLMDG